MEIIRGHCRDQDSNLACALSRTPAATRNRASPAWVTLPALSAATRAAGDTTGARAVPYLTCLLITLRGGFTAESTYASCVLRIGAAACSWESLMFCVRLLSFASRSSEQR
uniref:Uncharacterized protein n=1 Tax=Anopheles culicifacies TaxID=139723 RepID=A0A182MQY6_9DIPT